MVNWHLLPGERAIHETKMSRLVFWNYYFLALVLLLISAAVNLIDFAAYNVPVQIPKLEISGTLIVISIVITLIAERFTTREMVLITTERVLIRKRGLGDDDIEKSDVKSGITGTIGSVRTEALKLEMITNVQVRQTMGQRIMGMGDLVILAGMEDHIVRDLHHPFDIERAIYRIIEKKNDKG